MYIPRSNLGYGPNNGINSKVPDKKIIIFSGAGISQPSGIKTFRDVDGLWEHHDIKEICHEKTWKKNFSLVHQFYNQRRQQLKEVVPNIAHETVKRIVDKYGKDNVYNITQNVDDLFERAGTQALHLHGDLTKMHCQACGHKWEIEYEEFNVDTDRCPSCNSLKAIKPDIVFFEGSAPMYSYMYRAFEYALNPDTIVVIIGTMGSVTPIEKMLDKKPCKTILCNIEPSSDLPEKYFDKIYYEDIVTAITKIESDIDNYWKVPKH